MFKITFRKVTLTDQALIHTWLAKPHIAKWWDERTDHPEGNHTRKDLHKFVHGEESISTHWLALYNGQPYAYLMARDESANKSVLLPYLAKDGETWSMDFMIGEEEFLGKGLAHKTLQAFLNLLPPSVQAMLIDPEEKNTRAIHVYEKAGFVIVGYHTPDRGPFAGVPHVIMRWSRKS